MDVLARTQQSDTLAATVSDHPSPEWFAAYNQAESLPEAVAKVRDRIVALIAPPVAASCVRLDGKPVAVGLAVAERDWVGIFDMATLTEHRRMGYAQMILRGLAAWAHGNGAVRMYLQVMEDNVAARILYPRPVSPHYYRYHYRTQVHS